MKRIDLIGILRVRVASSCAKEDSIAFTSTAKPGNPPPCRVIEKFPREQFEAFAELLEFRRPFETVGHEIKYENRSVAFNIQTEAPPLTEDATGALRVGNSRVLLEIVVRAFQDGATPETIVQRYSTLALPDIYAVLAYYLRHPSEVEEYLARREQKADEVQQRIESQQGDLSEIRARLLTQRQA